MQPNNDEDFPFPKVPGWVRFIIIIAAGYLFIMGLLWCIEFIFNKS